MFDHKFGGRDVQPENLSDVEAIGFGIDSDDEE
jgi:hypothetical protein